VNVERANSTRRKSTRARRTGAGRSSRVVDCQYRKSFSSKIPNEYGSCGDLYLGAVALRNACGSRPPVA
jgi:hypothetical protein